MTDEQRSDVPAEAHRAGTEDDQPPRLRIFDPDFKFVDRTNFLNRLYDTPDEEWARWRLSGQDGGTLVRV